MNNNKRGMLRERLYEEMSVDSDLNRKVEEFGGVDEVLNVLDGIVDFYRDVIEVIMTAYYSVLEVISDLYSSNKELFDEEFNNHNIKEGENSE